MTAIDISRYQGAVNFGAVKSAGVGRVVAKMGGGDAGVYVDADWAANRDGIRAAGLELGSYFFNGPGDTPTQAADFGGAATAAEVAATQAAVLATAGANAAAGSANAQAQAAHDAAQLAADKTALAVTATQGANDAAALANNKATLANDKANLADGQATLADQKATAANAAAATATTATGAANTAATAATAAATSANVTVGAALAALTSVTGQTVQEVAVSRILQAGDNAKLLACTSPGLNLIYVPDGLPANFRVEVMKAGGPVYVMPIPGSVGAVNGPAGKTGLTTAYASELVRQITPNNWVVTNGDASAAPPAINLPAFNSALASGQALWWFF